MAPTTSGRSGNALLVANFGDGKINAFDPATGNTLGSAVAPERVGDPIDGLWGIAFATA
jgi:hypothetical protein